MSVTSLRFQGARFGTVFLPRAGTSVLVDELLLRGHDVILNDVSDEALNKLRQRLSDNEDGLTWLHHDISKPVPDDIPQAGLWIDRAVLYFLLEKAAGRG